MARSGREGQGLRWPEVPGRVRAQVSRLVDGLARILGESLQGIYLHGSLALGGFRPSRSDIDLLAVSRHPIDAATSRSLAQRLLRLSGSPRPLEFHLLAVSDLVPWRHPAPYQFHYSEAWRERLVGALSKDPWAYRAGTDPDLAAHVTVTRARGVALYGPPPGELLPEVPRVHFLRAVLSDLDWALARLDQDLPYAILNACRILAYLQTGRLLSKDEAGVWALSNLPAPSLPMIHQALADREDPRA